MNRAAFWGVGIGWCAAFLALGAVTAIVGRDGEQLNVAGYVGSALIFAALIAAIWSGLCIGVRRYHDLGKSGAWVLVQFVPVIGWLWYVIEAGCFRGQAGPNLYGADPLARLAPQGEWAKA